LQCRDLVPDSPCINFDIPVQIAFEDGSDVYDDDIGLSSVIWGASHLVIVHAWWLWPTTDYV
jgi:hypothetical protein